jgi:hypothetical protein
MVLVQTIHAVVANHDVQEPVQVLLGVGMGLAMPAVSGGGKREDVRILCEQTRATIEGLRNIGSRRADEIELALLLHGYFLQLPDGEEDA